MMPGDQLLTDLPAYAAHNLKIKPKTGAPIPLVFNRAQLYLHKRAEDQKRRTGKVRLIVLKGRQQGLSTYVGARYFHLTTCSPAVLTFIFAHDADGSQSLYDMVKTYYDLADPAFRPTLGKSNAKELLFPVMRSGYKVGTAGSGKGLGRSKTFQLLHWSEVAYSPSAEDHSAGILQTVADLPDTEIILESTSAGMGDYFYRMCKQAISAARGSTGGSDFELVFIPWYWQDEYKRKAPADFQLEMQREEQEYTSEEEYFEAFEKDGLTLEHLEWRRNKIKSDFRGDTTRFMREYPFYPEEAFEAAAADCFIKPLAVKRARNTPPIATGAPLIFGVDPARLGGDAFKVMHRKGRNLTKSMEIPAGRVDQTAAKLIQEINKYKPMRVNIDAGGLGVGVYDICVGAGYGNIVRKVDFGGSANDGDNNRNKRAEMYRAGRDWLDDRPVSINITDAEADKLQSELAVCKAEWFQNSQLQIIPKEKIKKTLGYSPDTADAFVLTFAEQVANPDMLKHAKPLETFIAPTSWNPFDSSN